MTGIGTKKTIMLGVDLTTHRVGLICLWATDKEIKSAIYEGLVLYIMLVPHFLSENLDGVPLKVKLNVH